MTERMELRSKTSLRLRICLDGLPKDEQLSWESVEVERRDIKLLGAVYSSLNMMEVRPPGGTRETALRGRTIDASEGQSVRGYTCRVML